ncbi:MAG: MBL fold metallo-hydrolase, partial [Cyanobacteriota bacterium]
MIIKKYCGGSFQVNNFIIACEETKSAAMIDAGGYDENNIYQYLDKNDFKLEYLFLTHGHVDHICGAKKVHDDRKVPVCLNNGDKFLLDMLETQLSIYGMPAAKPVETIAPVIDGQIINLGNLVIKIIATPGHSLGSVCYYIESEKVLFAGDTLFSASIGRTDLPGGSFEQ